MNYWLFVLPLIGALIGWIIGKIATWYLLYRVWPQRKAVLGDTIAKFVVQEFSSLNLEQKIADPGNLSKARPIIESHIDNFLRFKLKDQMPMISMFIGDKTIDSLKTVFMQELETLFPEVMKNFAGNMKAELGIEKVVREKISGISSGYLRKIISKELRWIPIICALTGFITGLIQIVITLLFF